jgi:hypothetical protein
MELETLTISSSDLLIAQRIADYLELDDEQQAVIDAMFATPFNPAVN